MFRQLTPVISQTALHVSEFDTRHQLGSYTRFGCWEQSPAMQLYMFRLLIPVMS